MRKEDYIKLIRVAEGIMKIEEASRILSGCGLDEGECTSVYLLWEVLRDNAAERFRKLDDMELDSENYRAFTEILENREMTAEEKWEEFCKVKVFVFED